MFGAELSETEFTLLQEEVEAGRVQAIQHPTLPLTLYNYTQQCQFTRSWNEINLQCRGLVLEGKKVIARPLSKFFNYEELSEENKRFSPSDILSITEKEDGSCIITFFYQGEWRCCTRGSFTSPQAAAALNLLQDYLSYEGFPTFWTQNTHITWVFELVGPSNVIVTRKHQHDKLVLLAALSTANGTEYPIQNCGFETPATYTSVEWVKSCLDPNIEGVVVLLKNGLRFKLKTELYIRLHRVLTGVFTPERIFNLWCKQREGVSFSDIPDEFFGEIRDKIEKMDTAYSVWYIQTFDMYQEMYVLRTSLTRGQMAKQFPSFVWLLPLVWGTTHKTPQQYLNEYFEKHYEQIYSDL